MPALFARQFQSPLIYLLFVAAALSLLAGERVDAGFILAVLAINAIIGTLQERRAETSMKTLRNMLRVVAHVRREGSTAKVDAGELVPGDVIEIESGMAVPADARLLTSYELRADEASLSGESMPVRKVAEAAVAATAVVGDRSTMLHAGTVITEGRGVAVVVATAKATALGAIDASLRGARAMPPPLVLRLQTLARQIAGGALVLIAALAGLLALQEESLRHILLLSAALAVSAIPEGLPIAVTVALAAAARRMSARQVIVRSLPAVEGLGACTLIASDKTGTLTMNRLSVERVLLASGRLVDCAEPGDTGSELVTVATAAAICNEARLGPNDDHTGDTVDVALIRFAQSAGAPVVGALAHTRRIAVLPYEPARKFSAAAVASEEGGLLYVKGAPETILAMCSEPDPALLGRAEALASDGYRVLALACRKLSPGEEPDCAHPADMQLLGFVALLDPLRPEVPEAIRRCEQAGISVRMVTGDHPNTARTIARQLGLRCEPEEVVTGQQMRELAGSREQLDARIRSGQVFARIEPTQKLTIVEAFSRGGELVAVTGDGVNDAPALQAAHVGVAMGRSGTDVAREASDLVIADDNFASIVAGVEEGRITYSNIRKIVVFLLATGAAEIGMFLGAVALGLPMPLTAAQLIWLNLITNGAQDVMLGFGKGEGDELRQPPRRPSEPLLDGRAIALILPPALAMIVMALLLMDWQLARGGSVDDARNAVLLQVVLFQNAYVICMRSERRPLVREPLLSNPWLLLGIAIALTLHVTAMHWTALAVLLGTVPVDSATLALCLAGAAVTVAVTEATKAVVRRRTPHAGGRAAVRLTAPGAPAADGGVLRQTL